MPVHTARARSGGKMMRSGRLLGEMEHGTRQEAEGGKTNGLKIAGISRRGGGNG